MRNSFQVVCVGWVEERDPTELITLVIWVSQAQSNLLVLSSVLRKATMVQVQSFEKTSLKGRAIFDVEMSEGLSDD